MRRKRMPLIVLATICIVAGLGRTSASADTPGAASKADSTRAAAGQDIRCVVIHRPGPAWQQGVDFREQPGVMEHVLHYKQLLDAGKLALGGPFLAADGGGMMIAAPGIGVEEIEAFAAADPAVTSGLLLYEVRLWYVAMSS